MEMTGGVKNLCGNDREHLRKMSGEGVRFCCIFALFLKESLGGFREVTGGAWL